MDSQVEVIASAGSYWGELLPCVRSLLSFADKRWDVKWWNIRGQRLF